VKGPEADHYPAAGSEDRRSCWLKAVHACPVLSETAPTLPMPSRRSRISSAMLGSWASGAQEMVPSASMTRCLGATSRDEEVAHRAFCVDFPVPRRCASGAAGYVAEPQSSASRVVCRCPRVASSRLGLSQIGCDPDHRSGEGASYCALRATSSKHGPRGPEADVGSGDESPREIDRSYADPVCLSTDRGMLDRCVKAVVGASQAADIGPQAAANRSRL
jgi:hypothetical protein